MPEQGSIKYAISSDLHGAAAAAVTYIWRNLEVHFGLTGAQVAENPSVMFSIFSAERAQEPALIAALAEAAGTLEPFSLFLDGVSWSEGLKPDMFLRVLKSDGAQTTFNGIWRALSGMNCQVDGDYLTDTWHPRCILAANDMKPEQVHKVRNYLRTQVVKWRSLVKAINLYRISDAGQELVESWPLGDQTPAETFPAFWQ